MVPLVPLTSQFWIASELSSWNSYLLRLLLSSFVDTNRPITLNTLCILMTPEFIVSARASSLNSSILYKTVPGQLHLDV